MRLFSLPAYDLKRILYDSSTGKSSLVIIINYRGMAKLSAIPKLLEHLITLQTTHFYSSLISTSKHGPIRYRLTTADFSKALDPVSNSLLLLKLSYLWFPNNLLKWIESILSNHTQRVLFNITSGVL